MGKLVKIRCTRCGKIFIRATELEAERAFDHHECILNGHRIEELTTEELEDWICRRRTEEQIWEDRAKN